MEPRHADTPVADAPVVGQDANVLRLTPLAPVAGITFELTHPYVEIVYLPSLGPTAVLLARSLGRLLQQHPEGVTVCALELSRELGMRASSKQAPLGGRSRLRKALDRLKNDHIVQWLDPQHLGVHTAVPALSGRALDKLPPTARRAHDRYIETYVVDLRDGPPDRQVSLSRSDAR